MITRTTDAIIGGEFLQDDVLSASENGACLVAVDLLFANGSGCHVGIVEQYETYQASRVFALDGNRFGFEVALPASDEARSVSVWYCGERTDARILAGSRLSVTPG